MCGICGFVDGSQDRPQPELESLAASMARVLRHRGPDGEGAWADASAGVALGFRRLAIIDLSETGNQPMISPCGRYAIVFNGEIYNYRALRRMLESEGHKFRGSSDTEVLLRCIATWGIDRTLIQANGMFALAVWDRSERALTLARDRFGEKPLYYGWMGDTLLFASELKALVRHPDFVQRLDRHALALFLRYGYIPSPHCIYEGVSKLPPGTTLRTRLGDSVHQRPTQYWSALDTAVSGLGHPLEISEPEAVDQLDVLLHDSVRMRMYADVPLGVFLSGGVDSSTVVAAMQGEASGPVHSFSIGFEDAAYNEATDAKAVAAHLSTDHTEMYVSTAEAQAVIPRLPHIYDEPFADSSQIPTFLVSSLARQNVTVALSGDGGDEMFGGYDRYAVYQLLSKRLERVPRPARRLAASGLSALPATRWNEFFAAIEPIVPRSARRRNVGDKLHKLARALRVDDANGLYRELVSHSTEPHRIVMGSEEAGGALSAQEWPSLDAQPSAQAMAVDTITYLPDDLLAKVDRASMATSLEARLPMLDHRVMEFAWRLPMEYKVAGGSGKRVLKGVLSRYVPKDLFERPKMGFGVPIGRWLQGSLRSWAQDLLSPSRLQQEGYLDPLPVGRAWQEHLDGSHDWGYLLWDVLMFESWLETHMSRAAL